MCSPILILINKNVVEDKNSKKNYFGPIADIKVGDEIVLQHDENGGSKSNRINTKFDKKKLKKVKIMAILNSDPFNYRGSSDGLKIITTEKIGEKLIGINDIKPTALNIVLKDIKSEEASKTGIENITKSNSSLMAINNIDNNRKSKSTILMVKILL